MNIFDKLPHEAEEPKEPEKPKPEVLFVLRSGDQILHTLNEHESLYGVFEMLDDERPWLYIHEKAVISTKDIMTVYYFPEGYKK